MEAITIILAITSMVTSIARTYFDYKKSKQPPKDEIWEAVFRLAESNHDFPWDVYEICLAYEQLKHFKENGYSLNGITKSRNITCSAHSQSDSTEPKTDTQSK